jgi:multiple sugar transport system substrate-binding protein
MKKWLLVLWVLLVSLGIAFAGGQGQDGGGGDKPVTLSIWGGYPEQEIFYKHAAEEYAKLHPNVKFEILTNPLREYEQKLSASIPSDTAGDILEASNYTMRKFVEAGLVPEVPANLMEFRTKPGRYGEYARTVSTWNNKAYGLPFFTGHTVLFWNTAMFKEAGLARAPQTLAEMAEYAKKLTKYDAQGNVTRSGHSLRLSGQGSGIAEKFWFVLYPMGGTILEESKTQPGKYHAGYNNDAGRKALKYYIDAVHVDKWDSFSVKHDAEAFELEQTAMFFRESWVVGDIAQKAPNLQYDTAFVPSDARWGRIDNPNFFYVTRSCKNPDVAWDFVLFMLNDDNQRWMFDNVGWLPCRTDVDYSAILSRKPQMKSFIEIPQGYNEYGYIPLPEFDEIITKLAERLATAYLDASLARNNAGIAKVIADAVEETNTILRRAGHYAD